MMHQHTLNNTYFFEGRGLHTGKTAKMTIKPARPGTGLKFVRTDLGGTEIQALADKVINTARSTTIGSGPAEIHTVEHVISALTGMGVDNAILELDNVEVPILDGSASFYVRAIAGDGLLDQGVERKYIDIPETVEVRDGKSGAWIRIEPADRPSIDVTVDFGSKVLGVQSAHWDESVDYAKDIGICRTFVFFHEIEFLFANNLIKGGDVDNAIVIVEHPVTEEKLDQISKAMGKPKLKVEDGGYLNNLKLHYPNECGRHKLLDLIGDIRLTGGWLNARITAFKPGHTINVAASKAALAVLGK